MIGYTEQVGNAFHSVFFIRSQPTDQITATQRLVEESPVGQIEDVNDADSG